jgi:ketosteroid isomerase-like protein
MTTGNKICLLLIFELTALISCRENAANLISDHESEKLLIERTIHASIGWAKNKDINLLYSIIDHDSSFLEVHPEPKVVKGFSDFMKAEKFWMSPDFKAIRYDISDLQINISQSGTVAWWFCMLDDMNEWKGDPANWENTRWTGIMEKRNGKWIIVQQHFSYAVE